MNRVSSFQQAGAEVLARRGHGFVERGDHQGAARCYRQALELCPQSDEYALSAAEQLVELERLEEAGELIESSWRGGACSPALAALACHLYSGPLGRLDQAQELLEDAERLFPGASPLRLARGDVLLATGEPHAARLLYERALEEAPQDPWAREGVAMALNQEALHLFERDETEQAIFLVKRALDMLPDWTGLHVNLGRMFHALGRRERALRELQAAIRGDPDDPVAYYNLGQLQMDDGDYEAALKALEKALALDREYPDIRPELAAVFHQLGRFEDASHILEEELAANGPCATCCYNLGLAYLEQDDVVGARRGFEAAVAVEPNYQLAHYNLGCVLGRQGETRGAVESFAEAYRVDPEQTRRWLRSDTEDFSALLEEPLFQTIFGWDD